MLNQKIIDRLINNVKIIIAALSMITYSFLKIFLPPVAVWLLFPCVMV